MVRNMFSDLSRKLSDHRPDRLLKGRNEVLHCETGDEREGEGEKEHSKGKGSINSWAEAKIPS